MADQKNESKQMCCVRVLSGVWDVTVTSVRGLRCWEARKYTELFLGWSGQEHKQEWHVERTGVPIASRRCRALLYDADHGFRSRAVEEKAALGKCGIPLLCAHTPL
jgi:hypothetical protein